MGPIKHRIHILFLFFGMALLYGCSGNLSTKVFLDRNGDNRQAESEPVLGSVQATLYRDGAQVDKLMTDSEGQVHFSISEKGKYCVKVDGDDITKSGKTLSSDSGEEKLLEAKSLGLVSTPNPTPDATPDATPKASPAAQSDTAPKTTVKAYEACAETNGPVNVSMDLPVPMDYAKTISSITDPSVYSMNPGDTVELPIRFPRACELKSMSLPEGLGLVLGVSTEMYHEVNWDDVVYSGGKPIEDTPAQGMNRDTIRQLTMKLKVADDIDLSQEGKTFEITPQVSCPSGLTLNLKTHTLEVGKQTLFELYHDRQGEAVPGGEVTVITHVVNRSSRDFASEDVLLTFIAPVFGESTFDPLCGSSHCSFAIAAGQKLDLKTKIKIPDLLTQNTVFELSAKLKVQLEGSERLIEQDAPAQFGVLPNP